MDVFLGIVTSPSNSGANNVVSTYPATRIIPPKKKVVSPSQSKKIAKQDVHIIPSTMVESNGQIGVTPLPNPKKRTRKHIIKKPAESSVSLYRTAEQLNQLGIETLSTVNLLPKSYHSYTERGSPPMAGMKGTPVPRENVLKGFSFIISGVLESLDRIEAENYIKACGGEVVKSVAKKTTHALLGEGCGASKMASIDERNIPKIDENGLLLLVQKLYCISQADKSDPRDVKKDTPLVGNLSDDEFEIDEDD